MLGTGVSTMAHLKATRSGIQGESLGRSLNDLWKYNVSSGQWTWMAGGTGTYANGTYGTQGVAGASNTPGARERGVGWVDGAGNVWMIGGYGNDSVGSQTVLSDVWKFNVANGQWIWVSGLNTGGVWANYGTYQVPAFSNVPGARQRSRLWDDGKGTVYIFGGFAYDAYGNFGRLNDVWTYTY